MVNLSEINKEKEKINIEKYKLDFKTFLSPSFI